MSEARWTKVAYLRKGMWVATTDGWEVITAVYKTGVEEQVYDLEIENTHNFVGNGIVAHNTTGKSLVIFNQTENQDLITASASGTTRFYINNTGDTVAGRFVDIANTAYLVDPAATGNAAVNIAGGVTTGTGILTSTAADSSTAIGFTLNTALHDHPRIKIIISAKCRYREVLH